MGLGRGTKWWDREGTEMGHAVTEGVGTGLAWWVGMEMGGYDNK